jgi:hypothetical protein
MFGSFQKINIDGEPHLFNETTGELKKLSTSPTQNSTISDVQPPPYVSQPTPNPIIISPRASSQPMQFNQYTQQSVQQPQMNYQQYPNQQFQQPQMIHPLSQNITMARTDQMLQNTVRVDSSTGTAVVGHLRINDSHQQAFDVISSKRAELEIIDLEKKKQAALTQVDEVKKLELDVEFDEKEMSKYQDILCNTRCGCFFSFLLICPVWFCCLRNYFGNKKNDNKIKISNLKARIKDNKKRLYLIKNNAIYTSQINLQTSFVR